MGSEKKTIELLNQALSDELAAIYQYMWHHFHGQGMESPAIRELFKEASMDEMKHAEALAERITLLGGDPTHQPGPVKFGGDLRKMIKDDLAAEEDAIKFYRKAVAQCEDDPTTRRLFESLLEDEERHADTWRTTLGK
ncbi:MAG TPA: ferritin-like domain-containing protein [Candidatus Acidoferrales bacterium]|nr:ferritin-like domain-containing protein [Candidatus Acidoferrales bacterium]